jgi:hypothetical protein
VHHLDTAIHQTKQTAPPVAARRTRTVGGAARGARPPRRPPCCARLGAAGPDRPLVSGFFASSSLSLFSNPMLPRRLVPRLAAFSRRSRRVRRGGPYHPPADLLLWSIRAGQHRGRRRSFRWFSQWRGCGAD